MEAAEMKTLLLNQGYAPISFIPWKRVVKLVVRDKVDILSKWDFSITYGRGEWEYPSIVRLKYYTPYYVKRRRYNRSGVFKRDKNCCQYCEKPERPHILTIDHVMPKAQGGKTSWENCVACCFDCNNKKANKTPKQAGMKLIRKPAIPRLTVWHEFQLMSNKHDDWQDYILQG